MDYELLSSFVLEALKNRGNSSAVLGPDADFWLVIIYLFSF